ncbi:MAG: hypothetical protein Kow0040_27390 [Thermogutta sp.]
MRSDSLGYCALWVRCRGRRTHRLQTIGPKQRYHRPQKKQEHPGHGDNRADSPDSNQRPGNAVDEANPQTVAKYAKP